MWDGVDTGSASVCRQCDCRRGVAVRPHVYTGRSHDHKLSCIARRGCVLYDGLRTRRLAAVGTDGESTNGLVSPLPVACASAIRSHRAHADDKGSSCKHARKRTPSWRQRSAIARACFPLRPRTRSFDLNGHKGGVAAAGRGAAPACLRPAPVRAQRACNCTSWWCAALRSRRRLRLHSRAGRRPRGGG